MKVPLEVIGVLDHKGPAQDDVAFVPLTTAKAALPRQCQQHQPGFSRLYHCQGGRRRSDGRGAIGIEGLLRQRHRVLAGQEDDFKVQDPAAAMEAQQGAIRTVALLLVAIASSRCWLAASAS